MLNTISARQIQRGYKKVLMDANKSNEPIVVMSNNKPQGAIIGLELLEKLQLDLSLTEALEEYRAGNTKTISTKEELEADFEEMRKEAVKFIKKVHDYKLSVAEISSWLKQHSNP